MTPTKVLRTVLCVTVVVAVLLFSAGCSKTYKTDYLKKYSSYLDYSLGADNWKLVDSQQDKVEFADFVYYYTWWSVDYKDSEGVERTLMFNNYTGSTPDDMHFMNAVIRAAAEISRDRIDKSIAPLYKGEGTEPNLTILISDYPLYAPENRDLSYSKPGVSTSDIPKLSDLDTAW
ncbi:MAG: hypothetical protein LBP91_03390, partial [Coriobacteriales bacterium]|nr:hypothetical protein [Coriobacteriales bacterium]